MESRRETVRVAKSEKFLTIKVEERRRHHSEVDIQIPLSVVDALLSGEDDELNLLAAVSALREEGEGVLVTVDDEESAVRIWVDRNSETED